MKANNIYENNKAAAAEPDNQSGFLKDLELSENADLIHWYNEMSRNNMSGALEDIKDEMVRRFLLTNWSAIEDVINEIGEESENRGISCGSGGVL